MQLAGHSFLVTGGASGLGAACAVRFHAAGASVIAADRDAAKGEAIASQLGERAAFVETDVTDPDSVQAAIDAASRLGPLRGVVNCAGILDGARIVGREGPHDLEMFARVVNVNLVGTFNVLRLAAAAMAALPPVGDDGERGVIINTASVAAFEGQIGQAAYAASKGGVASMTLPAARELAKLGIRVVAIAPGIFETAMMQAALESVRESLAGQTVFPPRFGDPREFAALAQHVIENPMLNGAVLRLDGAVRMAAR
ncbi:MAG: SDR family NAD(P)-dependent oxidoreductase [Planctomycetes bacterium]|nr:SDR family NAD(P)-dependent oxidoreductase [Planctomycetota bacterium]